MGRRRRDPTSVLWIRAPDFAEASAQMRALGLKRLNSESASAATAHTQPSS